MAVPIADEFTLTVFVFSVAKGEGSLQVGLRDNAGDEDKVKQLPETQQAEGKEPEKPGYGPAGVKAVNAAEPKNAGKPQDVCDAS
jgi:hypothetical protein